MPSAGGGLGARAGEGPGGKGAQRLGLPPAGGPSRRPWGAGCRRLASGAISRFSAGDLGMSGLLPSETEEDGGGGGGLLSGQSSLSPPRPAPPRGRQGRATGGDNCPSRPSLHPAADAPGRRLSRSTPPPAQRRPFFTRTPRLRQRARGRRVWL